MLFLKKQIKIILIFSFFVSFVGINSNVNAEASDQPVRITWQHYAFENQGNYYPATLIFTLQPGWKLYAPFGAFAESAPQLSWKSDRVISIDPLWPEPEKLDSKNQNTEILGYTKILELPLRITTKDLTEPASLEMTLRYVVCSEKQCIPQETTIRGAIDPQNTTLAAKQLLASYHQTNEHTPTPTKAKTHFNIFTVLAWAFIGGFILNFMPCVLPVLSLKLMTVLRFQGQEKQHVQRGFLLSALGIMAAFFGLSLIFAGLKAMGTTIGWGIHFQNPYFLIGLVLVISFFIFNVLGLWHFKQPQLSSGLSNSEKPSWVRDFGEGILVMILATPCTAPFVGAALGVALGQSWPLMMLILMVLSLGLAAPYLLVALFPRVVAFLPHPGKWMEKVRWVMAIALSLTVAWLLYVLRIHIGMEGIMLIIGLLLALAFLLWKGKKIPSKFMRSAGVSFLCAIVLTTPLWWDKTSISLETLPTEKSKIVSPEAPSEPKKAEWLSFDPQMISKLVSQGKIVFVDVTADWCLLCQVNKQNVMTDPKLQRYFDEGKIIPMRADWTNRDDDRIIAYIQSFQRYGIPMNVIYGPNAKEGILLSEWLTLEEIEEAYQEASP